MVIFFEKFLNSGCPKIVVKKVFVNLFLYWTFFSKAEAAGLGYTVRIWNDRAEVDVKVEVNWS